MKIVLALMGAALIGGCATVPPPQQPLATTAPVTTTVATTGPVTCDYEQMAKVDRAARSLRTYVQWVHCPLLTNNRTNPVS
jgi:hypothetical protein